MDRKIEKKTWTTGRIAAIVIALLTGGFLFSALYNNNGNTKLNVESQRLLTDKVSKGNFQEFIPVTGAVQPIKTVLIGAVEGGKVEEKLVEDGAMVKQGQLLVKLSNPDLLSNFLNQEANIVSQINQIRNTALLMDQQSLNLKEQALQVNYQIDLTKARLKRNRELAENNVISRVELEEMEAEFNNLLQRKKLFDATIQKDEAYQKLQEDQMSSSLDLMQRNLKITRQNLDNLVVKAPIDGQLSGLDLEIGELVTRGSSIAQIDDLTNFKIRVRIDEFYISRIFLNQEGNFTFAGKEYFLKIKKIYPQVTNGTFAADMVFTEAIPEGIKRGQSVSVKLELSAEEEATLLARGGFYQKTGGNWVYVIDPTTGNATKRNIRIGRQNPNYYEVLEGLQVGDEVIVSSYENFGEKEELVLR